MKYWRVEVVNEDKQEAHFIEAVAYSKKLIRKILKEIHPEWNVKRIVSIDSVPEKTKEQ